MKRRLRLIGLGFLLIVAIGVYQNHASAENHQPAPKPLVAQGGPTSTPLPVNLPTSTPTLPPATDLPTATATVSGPILAEAKSPDTNVRAEPDISANRLGLIQPGAQYRVLAKRFEWYQIEYPDTPSRLGWVHQSVVTIIGDPAAIPDIAVESLPTTDPTLAAREETAISATQTPGGLLTLTAQVFVTPQGIFTQVAGPTSTLAPGERLPTFTFPPFTNTPIRIEELRKSTVTSPNNSSGFAPIVPIVGLAALGLLGLLVGILRRL
ncbi:MAG: SH3 domain-containing protein [Chloroflexi bacterium]|nr:SH3 domain-containing protein [Chloroflexota bacterium]